MISIDTRAFEKLLSDFIDARDIKSLVDKFSKDRAFYYYVLKDISRGRSSINYKIMKKVARRKKVSENFIIEQAKSVLSYLAPYDEADLDDYYEILNVPPDASDEKIKLQWIELMKSHHPDKAGREGLDRAKKINQAYEVLGSPNKRVDYDSKYRPDIPIIVKDSNIAASRMFLYVIPFILVITISYLYLSSSGLLFKSEDDKERFVSSIENPTLPQIDVKTENDYKKIEPQSELRESEQPLVYAENAPVKDEVTENLKDLSENVTGSLKQGQSVTVNSENEVRSGATLENIGSESKESESLYVVKKGDSLWTISRKFGVSVDDISNHNKLTNNNLDVGDQIVIRSENKGKARRSEDNRAEFVKIIPQEYEPESSKRDNKESALRTQNKIKDSPNLTTKYKSKIVTPAVAVNDSNLRLNELSPDMPQPDEDSLYSFVSQYVSAYKNRDLQTIRSLFAPNAKENGVSIYKVLDIYKGNFSKLDIKRYDIKVRNTEINGLDGVIVGSFIVTFQSQDTKSTKSTRGNIKWLLKWRGHKWEIEEINYNLHDTKVID